MPYINQSSASEWFEEALKIAAAVAHIHFSLHPRMKSRHLKRHMLFREYVAQMTGDTNLVKSEQYAMKHLQAIAPDILRTLSAKDILIKHSHPRNQAHTYYTRG